MHGYTLEPDKRRGIIFVIAVLAYVITAFGVPKIGPAIGSLSAHIGMTPTAWGQLGQRFAASRELWNPLELPAVFGAIYAIYDLWIWRLLPITSSVPNFGGVWLGSYQDQDEINPHQFRYTVTQHWSRMQITFDGPDAISSSRSAVVNIRSRGAQEALEYVFKSTSKSVGGAAAGSQFEGTVHLSWRTYPDDLVGSYYTGLGGGRLGGANGIKRASAIQRELEQLVKEVRSGDIPTASTTWTDGDVDLCVPEARPATDGPWTVTTPHALMLSSVFRGVDRAFGSALAGSWRTEAYRRMAAATRRLVTEEPQSSADELMLRVLHEASLILKEMISGRFVDSL